MTSPQVHPEVVHPDTQAAPLLCGTFGQRGDAAAKPLTLPEYNALALWLLRQGHRPSDLIGDAQDGPSSDEPGLPRIERLRALLGRGMLMAAALERWQRLGLWVIGRGEDSYPEPLRRCLRSAAPPLLFGAGDVNRLSRGGLAVVGSRRVDEEGLSFTQRVADRCAGAGLQVISGGARGVDQAALSSCVEAGEGGVAVLADRLDRAATSRHAKESIRRGLLTLVTPNEPDFGFTVGRAMARNKHIYALADYALVVRFAAGEGGTWAGAVEQLRQNKAGAARVPVFVRVAHNPADGWNELRHRGALPFPEEEFWTIDIRDALDRAAGVSPDLAQTVPPTESLIDGLTANGGEVGRHESVPHSEAAPLPPPEIAPLASPLPAKPDTDARAVVDTCYSRCLPLLLQSLRDEPGERELKQIAGRIGLLRKQLKDWLSRAIGEGKVKKTRKGRLSVYVDASRGEEANLFDRGGDAA